MTLYRERLGASLWVYLSLALVIPASLLMLFPVSAIAGILTGVVLYAGCLAVIAWTTPVLEVTTTQFRAGAARIELAYLGKVQSFRDEEAFQERGPRLNVRAWLCIRGWIDPVVRVENTDPEDPAPYWLISSRQPEALEAALRAALAQR